MLRKNDGQKRNRKETGNTLKNGRTWLKFRAFRDTDIENQSRIGFKLVEAVRSASRETMGKTESCLFKRQNAIHCSQKWFMNFAFFQKTKSVNIRFFSFFVLKNGKNSPPWTIGRQRRFDHKSHRPYALGRFRGLRARIMQKRKSIVFSYDIAALKLKDAC